MLLERNHQFFRGTDSYYPGTTVETGGYMHGYISTVFCTNPANPMANNQQGSADATSSFKESTDDSRVLIYPNPTTGMFTLENTRFLSEQNLQLEIYSMLGKRVMSENIIGEKKHLLNLGNVPNGIYLVMIIAGEQVETIKLVKQ